MKVCAIACKKLLNYQPLSIDYPYYLTTNLEKKYMSLGNILLLVLILMLVGVFPAWPHSHSWGYAPTGGVGLLLIIVVLFLLFGRR